MSAESKAEAMRLHGMALDEIEAELGRERRLAWEILRANSRGEPDAGFPARRELAELRLRQGIASRRR